MSCCRNVTSFLRLSCFINRKSSRDVGIFWRWRTHVLIFRCRPCKYFLMTWRYPENKRGYKKNSPFLDRLVWVDRDSEHGSSGELGSNSEVSYPGLPRTKDYFRSSSECARCCGALTSKMCAMWEFLDVRNCEFSAQLNQKSALIMSVAVGTSSVGSLVTPDDLENAAKEVDRQLAADRQFPELSEQINASQS